MENLLARDASAFSRAMQPVLLTANANPSPASMRIAGEISQEQWRLAEPLIRRLYVTEGMSYKDVANNLKREYGFHPT